MDFNPVATGFCFLEAPRVDDRGVWFSECGLGGVRCLRPDGRIDSYLTDRNAIGGIAFNEDGALICSGPGGLAWFHPDTGKHGTLLDTIAGKPILGTNDVMPDRDGGLFFGTIDHEAIGRGIFNRQSALYHLSADMKVTPLCDGLQVCNGIGLSPDGRRLYHNESSVGTQAYDLLPNGGVGKAVQINDDRDCDGLAVDREGGIWIATTRTGTLTRVTPDGKRDRRFPVPGGHATSLCFGGPDGRDVYVATAGEGAIEAVLTGNVPEKLTAALYRTRVDIPGLPVPRTRFRLPF
jgi:sugar lactone lactonase YvrE